MFTKGYCTAIITAPSPLLHFHLYAPPCYSAPTHSRLRWIVLGLITVKRLLPVQFGVLCAVSMSFFLPSWVSVDPVFVEELAMMVNWAKAGCTGLPPGGSSAQVGWEQESDPWNSQKRAGSTSVSEESIPTQTPSQRPRAMFCVWGERWMTLSLKSYALIQSGCVDLTRVTKKVVYCGQSLRSPPPLPLLRWDHFPVIGGLFSNSLPAVSSMSQPA